MEDTDDTDQEEDPILYVPEPDDDTLAPGLTQHQQTDDSPHDDDDEEEEEEEQNWLQLQNVSTEHHSVMCGQEIHNTMRNTTSGLLNILCWYK